LEHEESTPEEKKPPQNPTEAFEQLANLVKKREKRQMEKVIGQVLTTQEGKEYLATSMREVGDKYLFFLISNKEPLEMIVGEVKLNDDCGLLMGKYSGSDYDELLKDFMNNALNDLQCIKTQLWMDEVQ